jgi:hypothetical protein
MRWRNVPNLSGRKLVSFYPIIILTVTRGHCRRGMSAVADTIVNVATSARTKKENPTGSFTSIHILTSSFKEKLPR